MIRPWTPDEDAIVRRVYPLARGRARCAKLLPHRSIHALAVRASTLNVVRGGRHWTAAEDKLLRLVWGEQGERTVCQKLPGRTPAAIVSRAKHLRLGPQATGRVSIAGAARRLGIDDDSVRALVREAGAHLDVGAPIAPTRARHHKHFALELDGVEVLLTSRDLRCATAAAWDRHVGVAHSTTARLLASARLHRPSGRGSRAWIPRDVLAELTSRRHGDAVALWRRVSVAATGLCAPWVLFLAATDLAAGRGEWVHAWLPQRVREAAGQVLS